MSVSLGTDSNGRHTVTAGSVSVRCSDEETAKELAAFALEDDGRRRRRR